MDVVVVLAVIGGLWIVIAGGLAASLRRDDRRQPAADGLTRPSTSRPDVPANRPVGSFPLTEASAVIDPSR